jgi:hypothetical protein
MRRETSTVDSTIKGARCAGVGRVTVQRNLPGMGNFAGICALLRAQQVSAM